MIPLPRCTKQKPVLCSVDQGKSGEKEKQGSGVGVGKESEWTAGGGY